MAIVLLDKRSWRVLRHSHGKTAPNYGFLTLRATAQFFNGSLTAFFNPWTVTHSLSLSVPVPLVDLHTWNVKTVTDLKNIVVAPVRILRVLLLEVGNVLFGQEYALLLASGLSRVTSDEILGES